MDNIKKIDFSDFYFSYSSLTTFEQCPFAFRKIYLEKVDRANNFFSDYGSFCHHIIEMYFKNELEIWDLLDYYEKNFSGYVKEFPPSFMPNVYDSYYNAGHKFFQNFNLDKTQYEIINMENYVRGTDRDINLVVKPDLIFREEDTGDIVIMDFKTSEIKNKYGRIDEKKINGYKKQLNIYVYYLWIFKNLQINKCRLWFIRSNTFYEWNYNQYECMNDLEWVENTVEKIKQEKDWEAKPEKFFCGVLCSSRTSCPFGVS